MSIALDGFANANPRTLFVASAGNYGPGPDTVVSPGSAYNNLSVAALGPNPPYDRPASFSSGGPNDYADPVNGTKNDARQVVDIAAPGENLSSAYYGGETGGNGTTDNPSVSGPGPTGLPRGSLGGPDFYHPRRPDSGTSFAAPTVAGGAALLYDAAYSVFAGQCRCPRCTRDEGRADELGRQDVWLEQRASLASQRKWRRAHHARTRQSSGHRPDEPRTPRTTSSSPARPTSQASPAAILASSMTSAGILDRS